MVAIDPLAVQLGRDINPTVNTRVELGKRIDAGNSFVERVLAQSKIWLIGSEGDSPLENRDR